MQSKKKWINNFLRSGKRSWKFQFFTRQNRESFTAKERKGASKNSVIFRENGELERSKVRRSSYGNVDAIIVKLNLQRSHYRRVVNRPWKVNRRRTHYDDAGKFSGIDTWRFIMSRKSFVISFQESEQKYWLPLVLEMLFSQ